MEHLIDDILALFINPVESRDIMDLGADPNGDYAQTLMQIAGMVLVAGILI